MALTITIEKNIPIPGATRKPTMPLGKMQVGDSFALFTYEVGAPCVKVLANRVAASIYSYSNRLCGSKKFAYRTMNKTSVRVWRIK